ncbi:hypothetical protein VDGD_20621 [Verticillium dahliae]|nr:hypothetical protein VDGD_20621 [Verticillium dahliae]
MPSSVLSRHFPSGLCPIVRLAGLVALDDTLILDLVVPHV